MKAWSLFDVATGILSSKNYSGPDDWVPAAHEGLEAIEGEHDHLCKRVDVALRDSILEQNRDAHRVQTDVAQLDHENRVLELRSEHESNESARRVMLEATIEDARRLNQPTPRPFVKHPFIEPTFEQPRWIESIEVGKATRSAIVDYQPPKPSNDHEWDDSSKRWRVSHDANVRRMAASQARGELARLESQQLRIQRKMTLAKESGDTRAHSDALSQLTDLDRRCDELEAILK